MKTFFNSSAFAKRYIEEEGSDEVDRICGDTSSLALSIICIPEIISALNRRVREKNITKKQYSTAKSHFLLEINDCVIINLTPTVVSKSIILLEKFVLRGMDALHIACAIEWESDLFVSSDTRQIEVAKRSGLKTFLIPG